MRWFNLRGLVDEVGTATQQHNGYIYIPDLRKELKERVIL